MVDAIGLSPAVPDAPEPKTAEARDPGKVLKAAQDFEALLMGQLLKNMRESSTGGWLSMGEDDKAGEQAMAVAEEFFARGLSAQGGLGLAKMVAKGLNASGKENPSAPVNPPSS